MRAKVGYLWHRLTTSFWLVPCLALVLAIALAIATLAIDARLGPGEATPIGWLYGGGPAGARSLLSTVAGAMITVASLVFSLTLIALTMATAQFGPRLLQTFMRDLVNQIALGAFLGTFVFALLVLRTVGDREPGPFVPHVSTSIAVVLAVASFVWLIYFIHHVAESLQADTVIASVGAELTRVIRESGASSDANERDQEASPSAAGGSRCARGQAASITIDRTGYVQAIDRSALLETAAQHDVLVRLARRPGDFLVAAMPVALAWPPDRAGDEVAKAVLGSIVVGPKRTATQDVEFVVANLVEVALRALSPGINDPHTAITCIDRLTSALAELMQQPAPTSELRDADGALRLVWEPLTFDVVLSAAFREIAEAGRGNGAVLLRLVDALAALAGLCDRAEQQSALRTQADRLARIQRAAPLDEADARAAAQRLRELEDALRARPLTAGAAPPGISRVEAAGDPAATPIS